MSPHEHTHVTFKKNLLVAGLMFALCFVVTLSVCVAVSIQGGQQFSRTVVYGMISCFTYFVWRMTSRRVAVVFFSLTIVLFELIWIPRFEAIP